MTLMINNNVNSPCPAVRLGRFFYPKVFTILNITIMTNKIEDIDNITVKEIFVQLGIGAAMGCALIAACCLGGWLNHFFS